MNSSATRIARVALAVALGLAALYAGFRVWRNYRVFTQTESAVRDAINEVLRSCKLEPITSLVLPGASRLSGVPEVVKIEHCVFRVDSTLGRRPAGWIRGSFHRITGEIKLTISFNERKPSPQWEYYLAPVPD